MRRNEKGAASAEMIFAAPVLAALISIIVHFASEIHDKFAELSSSAQDAAVAVREFEGPCLENINKQFGEVLIVQKNICIFK